MQIATYFPLMMNDSWHGHICLSLCEHMRSEQLSVVLVSPAVGAAGERSFTRAAVPRRLLPFAFRADKVVPLMSKAGQLRYRRELAQADTAYLWAGVPMSVYRDVAEAGLPLIVERINCHRKTAKRLLDDAYARVGLPPDHGLTDEATAEESEKLGMADYVFAPSPAVRASLIDAGIPERKILQSTYGWSPRRVHPRVTRSGTERPFTAVFVGSICIRKGAHVLLEAWARANIPGARLVLCGGLSNDVQKLCGKHLARADVEYRGHVADVGPVYDEADALVLPTVEEGSPLVVYEAMAAGAVPVTSPMGAGEVVRAGVDGCVIDPHDREQIAEALWKLAENRDMRAAMQASGAARASEFTWDKVAARRRALLLDALRVKRAG